MGERFLAARGPYGPNVVQRWGLGGGGVKLEEGGDGGGGQLLRAFLHIISIGFQNSFCVSHTLGQVS